MYRYRVFRFLESYNFGKRVRDQKDYLRLHNEIKSQTAKTLVSAAEQGKLYDPHIESLIKEITDKYPQSKVASNILKTIVNKQDEEQKKKQIVEIVQRVVEPFVIYEIFYPAAFKESFDKELTGFMFIKYNVTLEELVAEALREVRIYFSNSQIVSEAEVEKLKSHITSSEQKEEASLKAGDEVKLVGESTKYPGFFGRIRAIKGDQADVDIFIFDHEIMLTVDLKDVQKIDKKNQL